ncbi:MAG: PAS domain S-box protein [Caldimonas sp.]
MTGEKGPDRPKKAASLLTGADETSIFRTLFAAYPDSLIVADANGVIVLASPSAATLLGYSVEELVGLEVDALVPDAIRPRHAAFRGGFNRDPRSRPMGTQMDLVARRKDGSEVMVEIALSPLQDHGLLFVVAAIRDIGAYPRVKQALQRAHYSEQLATLGRLAVDARDPQVLLDQLPITAAEALSVEVATVYLLADDRLSLRVASTFAALPGEAVGDRVANRPDTSLGFVLAQGRSIIVRDYVAEWRFSVPPAYLDAGLMSALAVPLSDRGRTIGVLAVRSRASRLFGNDEVRFLESLGNLLASGLQRTQSEEQLKHAQRLETVGQLTGGIAHDFNNLLTVIQGNLQVLDELPLLANDPSARQLVGAAARASRRGAELTSKLLAFSRRQVLQPQVVDVAAMLHSLADMLRRTLDQRIRITVDVATSDVQVLADPGQLESALLNIAINSRDAMPEGGSIAFGVEARGNVPDELRVEAGESSPATDGFLAISITDSGAGMSAEAKERAFEPFFTTKEAGRGTGLGLSTVYGFAKQSRGVVTIDSTLGQGTILTLYIPRPRELSAPLSEEVEAGQAVPSGLSVLLVEDDAEVREVIRRFLETLGCVVSVATSGEQALLVLDPGQRFDLLVTDIALGAGIRGTELAARTAARLPEIAVLLMSGFSAELLDADRDAPPAWELLRKPCTREELGKAIVRVLRAG